MNIFKTYLATSVPDKMFPVSIFALKGTAEIQEDLSLKMRHWQNKIKINN